MPVRMQGGAMGTIQLELRNEIEERFCFGQKNTFSDDDSFLQKGILDSLGMMVLVTFIESNYQIAVDDGDLIPENLDSINALAQFIRRKTAQQNDHKLAAHDG